MASEIQLPKAVEGSKRILKIDLPSKASNHNLFVPKDGSSSDATSCISSLDTTAKESEIDQESLMAESSYMYYPVNGLYGYYYPEYDAQSYFVDNGAFEVQQSVASVISKGFLPINNLPSYHTVRKDDYNLPDFRTKYDHALFFIIKSYSEDDVHKSIKYNVWASTPNGNKRLDNAFQLAQERKAEKSGECPVFLFFSVNASGQFCGVAEMIGRVDFSKNMDFWQQDKWNGYFPVKWHIIKDVPNSQFRHIILENNENKPVTNSRDTQEVKFRQGTDVLNIFKNYSCKTSILEDFNFYENREKALQDKRIKLPTPNLEQNTVDKGQARNPDVIKSIVSGIQSIKLAAIEENPAEFVME